jgi:hypothetical protein
LSNPISPGTDGRTVRPTYLLLAMILTWFIGIEGVTRGIDELSFLYEGRVADVAAVQHEADQDPLQYLVLVQERAQQAALVQETGTAFPFAVAQMLLGGVILIASGLAMAGRLEARSVTLQALALNALLAVAAYVLLRDVRAASISAVLEAASALELKEAQRMVQSASFWWWVHRTRFFLFDLGAIALSVFAITRPRARQYFKAMSEAAERAEEP